MPLVGVGNRISAIGASQVAQVGVPPVFEGDGFFFWVIMASGGRFVYHPNESAGGESLSQTLSRVANYDTHVSTYGAKPSHVIVQAGRNNMDGGAASALSAVSLVLDALLDRGILPIITELVPSDTTDQMVAAIHYNIGLSMIAAKRNLPFIRVPLGLIDETTGGLVNTYAQEALGSGVHLNKTGAKLFGEYIADRMLDGAIVALWEPLLARTNESTSAGAYKRSNMILLTDTNADGIPDGWSASGESATFALEDATADGVAGNWLKVSKAATTADSIVTTTLSTAITPGNWWAIGYAMKHVGTSGTVIVESRSQTPTQMTRDVFNISANVDVVRQWRIVKVPTGATSITIRFLMNAVGDFYFGQPTIVDLTAAGIDGYI